MYDTIIFDLDGTLLNTLDDLCNSVNYALENCGYECRTLEEIRCFVGNGVRKLIERALPYEVGIEEFAKVFELFREHYKIHCNELTGPYDGIMELLSELKSRGYKMGITSNKMRPAVLALNDLYFEGFIQGAAGVDDNIMPKPNPQMVNLMLNELGSDKEHTLYVGDSQVDIETARNTGLDMVTVLWGFRTKEELLKAGAKDFIEHPMELLKYLN